MSTNAIEVQGTLREDGTLELDNKPNLPAGRVKVTVEPVPDLTQTDVWPGSESHLGWSTDSGTHS